MSNVQLGKSLKDIPFNKIHEGMRVVCATTNCLGHVLKVKKDSLGYIESLDKRNVIAIDWDGYDIECTEHEKLGHIFYAEETK